MTRCDAVIVGGGPAGSSCAWRLASAGLDAIVLDTAQFPRDKPCAGWITPAVLDALALRPHDLAACGLVVQDITDFRTSLMPPAPVARGSPLPAVERRESLAAEGRGFSPADSVHTTYDRPVSYGIRRCEFDHFLLQRSGARILTGTRVTALARRDHEWIVNDEFHTPLLIGAGGHFCPVARHLNTVVPDGRKEPVVAHEIEIRLPVDRLDAAATPEFHFCPDLKGYGWIFRKGAYLNVGLGRQDTHAFPAHVAWFQQVLSGRADLPREIFRSWHGHAYLLAPEGRTAVADQVLLIGDAAGLADSRSGEGIRAAVESGLLAAQAVLDAEGVYTRDRLMPYAAVLRARFGHGQTSAFERLMPSALARALAPLLMRSPWFTRHIILDRWFLGNGRH